MIVTCTICGSVVYAQPLHYYGRGHTVIGDVADADAVVTTEERDEAFYFTIRDHAGRGIDGGMHNHKAPT